VAGASEEVCNLDSYIIVNIEVGQLGG
jgi:hypothetical protein